ncbi:MAG: magnesium transporter [Pseudomonadales bacterium]
MDTEIISVRASVSIDVVLRYLRRHDEIPTMTDNIFIVNRFNQYIGTLPLRKLLVSETGLTVRDVMETDTDPINADMHDSDVAAIFARYDLVSAPVVDDQGQLLGRITIDDVVDVIIEDADQSLLGMAGLSDDDTFAPIVTTVKSRTLWLGANLFTAFIASAVINIFEDTLEKVIALAVLMPIVASMGGVAGSQTLTVVIRSMAQGHIIESNQRWLLMREVGVGIANGLIWSGVVAIAAAAMFNDTTLGFIIALALIINLISAALAGATIPMTLKRFGIDPAIAGTVILTTVTDVVGFVSFLGLATIFYA